MKDQAPLLGMPFPRITLPLGNHRPGAPRVVAAAGAFRTKNERAGLERDGGQVPDRRYIGVIAWGTPRVTPGGKKL